MSPKSRPRKRKRLSRRSTSASRTREAPGQPPPAVEVVSLAAIERHERENFANSRESLTGEFVRLADDGFALYRWLAERDSASDAPEREDLSLSHFIIGAGSNLYLAALGAMRAHGSDAALYTRRAVEGAAFLIAIRHDPASFRTWLDAADGDEQEAIYRRRFKTVKVLPLDSPNPRIRYLRKVFDECSAMSHPSIKSFAGRLRPALTKDGEKTAKFTFFESATVHHAGRAMIWTFEAHGYILDALSEELREPLKLDATDWTARLKAWKGRVAELRKAGEKGRPR